MKRAYTPAQQNAPHRFAAAAVLILALGFISQLTSAPLTNVFISQSGNGSQSGADCNNTKPASFFNNGANWGSGAAQIGPGTTVHACGTFTGSANGNMLTFQGSGASGNPIILVFETGAVMTAPYWNFTNGAISLIGLSNITIDGGVPCGPNEATCNGRITATANGSGMANQQPTTGIAANGTTNVTIKNIAVVNMYVNIQGDGSGPDKAQLNAIDFGGSTNFSFQHGYISQCGFCLLDFYNGGTDLNIDIGFNRFDNFDHGWATASDGSGGGSTATNTAFHDNDLCCTASWDQHGHHDGVHAYQAGSHLSSAHQMHIYNNYFHGDWGTTPTGFIFIEGGTDGARVTDFYMWNNVGNVPSSAVENTNGWFGVFGSTGGVTQLFNNTITGPNTTNNTACFNVGSDNNLTFENNVVQQCGDPVNIGFLTGTTTINHDGYGTSCQNGNNCFVWNGGFTGSFANFQNACLCDAASIQNNNLQLNANGSPQATSPLIGLGANLTSISTGALASLAFSTSMGNSLTPTARPGAPGAWTAGAFNSSSVAPAISISPSTLTFPGQVVGTTSVAGTQTVTNVGGATLTISALPSISGTNAPDFAIAAGTTCTPGANIAPSGTCLINSTFTPGATGSRVAVITVTGNAPTVSGGLAGTGIPATAPAVGIAPNPLNFGNQVQGTTSGAMGVIVTNVGTANLVLNNPNAVTITGTEFVRVAGGCADGATIVPGGTCPLTFTFTPSALGARLATLTVHGNASGSSTLTGTGTGTPAVSIAPSPVTFPTTVQGTTSAAVAVTITNSGTANLIFNTPPLSFSGTNGADFVDAGTGNCGGGSTVVPGAHCTANITFRPSTAGPNETGILSVNSNAAAAQVTLNGTVSQPTAPAVSITPNPLTFPGTVVGVTSGSLGLTVTNVGTANLILNNPNAVTITGTEFVRVAGGCADGATLTPGSTCPLTFTFTPSATGPRSATVTVHGNASGSSTLNGTGTAPAAAAFTLTPTTFNFGSQRKGTISALHNFSIASTGGSALVMNSVSFFNVAGGTNPADFPRVSPGGSDCVAGQSYPPGGPPCLISLAFMPSGTGAETATLSINANVTGPTAALSGTGIFPALTVTPASPINFGSINQGSSSAAIVVTVRNSGTDTENLSTPGVTITGDFSASAKTCNDALAIAPAGTCTVSVIFSPTAGGVRTGTLTINGDVSATVQLTGTGIATAPVITITPRPVQFPNTNVAATSPTVSATVTNTGTATETFSSFVITGAEFAPAAGSTCGGTLGAGLSCIYNMAFTPTTTGLRTGTLTVTGTASNSVALNGSGVTVSPPPAPLPQFLSLTLPAGTLKCSGIFHCNPIPLSVAGKNFLSTTTITLDGAALTTACTSVVCTAAIPSPTVSLPGFGSTAHTISLK